MPYDAKTVLQTLTTKTDDFSGTAVDLTEGGTPRRGLFARVVVTGYRSQATAGSTFRFNIDHSDDNTTFTSLTFGDTLTGGTASASAVQYIPVNTDKRYVRLTLDRIVASGTPSITYSADLGISKP